MKQGNRLLRKIELKIESWWRAIPHLPREGQRWLAENVWWMALVAAILSGISVLILINRIFELANPVSYSGFTLTPAFTGWTIFIAFVSLFFAAVTGITLAAAVKPLRAIDKKGWTLLFIVGIVEALNIVVNAILGLSIFTFIVEIIFGAIGVAIGMYFLFEIRDHFAHVVREKAKTTKK